MATQSTFRSNRTALALASAPVTGDNVFEDNLIAAIVKGRVAKVSVGDDGRTKVSGNGIAGAEVELYGEGGLIAKTTANADGAFEVGLEE